MARVEIPDLVWRRTADNRLAPAGGAQVTVNVRGGGPATVYVSETGEALESHVLEADPLGRIEAWLEEGSYELAVSLGDQSYTQNVEAVSGALGSFNGRLQAVESDGGPAKLAASQNFTQKQRIDRASAANAWLQIGSGTGSLTDKSIMGFKAKLDSTPSSSSIAGGHANVNVVDGTPAGAIHGFVARVDVNDNDNAVAGDTVALWGDVFVNQPSGRPTWGLNAYVDIAAGITYPGTAVAAELGIFNDGGDNPGGVLHLVSRGANKVQFGLMINESGEGTCRIKHGILIADGVDGPDTNAIYFGDLIVGNEPTGTPKFRVNAAGDVLLGAALDHDGSTVGFYGTAPVAKQTGVAVTAAGVHAALVNLGLIAA